MKTFRGDAGALPGAGGLEFCMMVPERVFIPWAEGLKPDFTKARKKPCNSGPRGFSVSARREIQCAPRREAAAAMRKDQGR
jgi:hypothetical protein